MGYILRREIRDALPPGLLSAAERLLVLEIADQCRDTTRWGCPGVESLSTLTDLSPRSIQELLRRIGEKWIEIRVPLGTDDRGKAYYSHRGRRITFAFPVLPKIGGTEKGATDSGPSGVEGATEPGAFPSEGAMNPGASMPEGATDPSERCDESVLQSQKGATEPGASPSVSSFPQEIPSSLSADHVAPKDEREDQFFEDQPQPPEPATEEHPLPTRLILEHTTITDPAEAIRIADALARKHRPRSNGWWRTVASGGDLPALVDEARPGTPPLTTSPDKPAARCARHPAFPAHNCSACRSERIAVPAYRPAVEQTPVDADTDKPAPTPDRPRPSETDSGRHLASVPEPHRYPRPPLPPCGLHTCRDGVITIGINQRPCRVCAQTVSETASRPVSPTDPAPATPARAEAA